MLGPRFAKRAVLAVDWRWQVKYRVHIYAVSIIEADVEADDHAGAISKAHAECDLLREFEDRGLEYANEVVEYLVDEEDDPAHNNSRSYLDRDHLRSLCAEGYKMRDFAQYDTSHGTIRPAGSELA